jgi:demethylmenaquinone methyltransferase / 2-methoxy-6-polyprenyl-1,4-benzoquinol methylase
MAQLSGKERANYVRGMFARVAGDYDRANRWMTWGQNMKWRRDVLDLAHLPTGGKLLDIGTGTGDLALEAVRRDGSLLVVGGDFTPEMMRVGRVREGGPRVRWLSTDALDLPLPEAGFDAVISGYLLRNVSDVRGALREQYRVLKPGGTLVCLDTTPLPGDIWHLPARLYLRVIIPIIGGLIAGEAEAYSYLPESTQRFMNAEELAECMLRAGFREVRYRHLMGGTIAIHWGVK